MFEKQWCTVNDLGALKETPFTYCRKGFTGGGEEKKAWG